MNKLIDWVIPLSKLKGDIQSTIAGLKAGGFKVWVTNSHLRAKTTRDWILEGSKRVISSYKTVKAEIGKKIQLKKKKSFWNLIGLGKNYFGDKVIKVGGNFVETQNWVFI